MATSRDRAELDFGAENSPEGPRHFPTVRGVRGAFHLLRILYFLNIIPIPLQFAILVY